MSRLPIVATLLGDKLNGVSLWRTVRPWADLNHAGAVTFKPIYDKYNEHDTFLFDVFYISHASHHNYLKIAEACKLAGKKVWVDLDDDLLGTPVHNMAKDTIARSIDTMLAIVKMADVFTASTPEIAEKYGADLKCPVYVLPNCVHPEELQRQWNGGVRGLWRSNFSQVRDMQVCWKDFDTMTAAGVQMAFIGAYPPWLDNPAWTEWGPTMGYFSALRKANAAYFWKPLEENAFNRAKSNVALLEGAMSGALTVCNLKHDRWRPAISAAEVRDRNDNWKTRRYEDTLAFIEDQYNAAKVNEQRYRILVDLIR